MWHDHHSQLEQTQVSSLHPFEAVTEVGTMQTFESGQGNRRGVLSDAQTLELPVKSRTVAIFLIFFVSLQILTAASAAGPTYQAAGPESGRGSMPSLKD